MHLLTPRRLRSACALSLLAVTAFVAPTAASAEPVGEKCSGASIEGKGASLQKLSQISLWNPAFNTSANAAACNGTQGSLGKPTVKYTSTGSGPGLESWGQETKSGVPISFGATNAYVGTDEPPSLAQKAEIEARKGGTLLTIPVEQAAVTVSLHLPANCLATSEPAPGRLVLKDATLEKIFRGAITKWSQIKDSGDKLSGTGCVTTTEIKRSVRLEGSGTTSLFKKFLGVVYPKEVEPGKTWKQLAESANNTTWPKQEEVGHKVIRGEGNGGVAKETAATPGTIAYINLADARANKNFSPPLGGEGKATFWAPIQHGTVKVETKSVATYADPSTNGDAEAAASSNCTETLYTNGKKRFPPPLTSEAWNEVSTSKIQKHYDICGFTYDLALTKYGTAEGTSGLEASKEEVRTVFDYYTFELATGAGGGQTLLGENHDYLGLPESEVAAANVLKIAREGVSKIGF
jgi:ABC-type phosphate transport system substrate-binding protein